MRVLFSFVIGHLLVLYFEAANRFSEFQFNCLGIAIKTKIIGTSKCNEIRMDLIATLL